MCLLIAPAISFAVVADVGYTQPQGLVGYWNLDQGSGTIVNDSSGYNNHGTIIGASWTIGKINGALNFDGLNDYVDCGNNEILDPTQGATFEAWVYFNQLPSAAKHIMAIAGRSGGGTDLDLQAETDNRFKFYIGPGVPNVAVSNTVIETNKWYHVVGTYQAKNNIKIYVNGVLEKTTLITITRNTNSNKFYIGQSCVWPGRFFNGIIDEVKIYNRALSAEEIVAEYTHMLPAPILSNSNDVKGERIDVTGPAGAVPANTTVQLYWDTTIGAWDGAKGLMNLTTADATGAYEVWFWVPEATFGTHQVWVKDADGDTAFTAFSVKTDNENSPESGLPGDTITGNFYGFHATKSLGIILSTVNPPVSTASINENLATPNGVAKEFTGTFAHKYLVAGTIIFRTNGVEQAHDDGIGNVVDSAGPLTASGTINYVTGEYTIIFTAAPPALSIGLRADYSYLVTSSAPGSTQFDLGTGVTNGVGSATISWKVPTNVDTSRTYNVFVIESLRGLNNVAFRIMGIQLSSSSGPTGETINITGNGFSPDEAWNASIGDKALKAGTISASGLLQGGEDILVPYGLSPGVYTITVLDVDSDADSSAQFTVTYNTSITVTPEGAPNNWNITISGKGFSYLATGPTDLTFKLYNVTSTGAVDHIWNMNVEQNQLTGGPHAATVNGTGKFTAYWTVPGSTTLGVGKYYIKATDADGYLGQTTFNVLPPHIAATSRNEIFRIGDTISFQLEDSSKATPVDGSVIKIYDPSGSLVFSSDTLDAAKWIKTGIWYTLPYSAQTASGKPMIIPDDAPAGTWSYKWVGTDGKDIATGTFTVAQASGRDYQFVTVLGSKGSGNLQFNYPLSVAVDIFGNIYIADTNNSRIQKLTSSGEFIAKWGNSTNGQFRQPIRLTVDSSGNIYVIDASYDNIQKLTSNGELIAKWGSYGSEDGQFKSPYGIAVDSSGKVYVLDINTGYIQKFTSSGVFITKWHCGGNDVAVDHSNYIYTVNDTCIQKFTSDGKSVAKWGSKGSGDGQFNNPQSIAIDNSGNIYVADTGNYRIQKFTPNGEFITKWGSQGSGSGQFKEARDVTVDSSENVYVIDSSNNGIQKFTSSTAGDLKVTIKEIGGATISRANVSSTSQPTGQATLSGITYVNGTIVFKNVLSGNYTIQAQKSGYTPSTGKTSVTLGEASELTVTIQAVPTTGGLKVTVRDSSGAVISGASISSSSQPNGQVALSGSSSADGTVTFSNLLPGSYTLQASKSGYVAATGAGIVTVGATGEVTITLQAQSGGGGIPGYPMEAIIFGVLLCAILMWVQSRRSR